MQVTDALRKTPSLIFGITQIFAKLVFSDAQDNTTIFVVKATSAKCWAEKLAVEMGLLLVSVHHRAWLHLAKAFLYTIPTTEH